MNKTEYIPRFIEFDYEDFIFKDKVTNDNKKICILQKFESDESGVLWDASLMIAKFIEYDCHRNNYLLNNCNVIELGSGTGFLGIWFAVLGASVLMTDQEKNLDLININIDENSDLLDKKKISVKCFDWNDTIKYEWNFLQWKSIDEIDYILISDCIYYEKVNLYLYLYLYLFY